LYSLLICQCRLNMMQKPKDPYQEAGSFWIILGLPTQEKHNN
jgi:hypothetical protein